MTTIRVSADRALRGRAQCLFGGLIGPLSRALAATFASLAGAPAWADYKLNMPEGVTTTSHEIYDLHMLVFGVCTLIAIGVYAAMVYAIVKFRKSAGAKPAKFSHNTTIEVVWTVIPAAILVALAIPAAGTLIRMNDTRNAQLTIKVTGYQWRWHYDYIDDGVKFFSVLDRKSNAARQVRSGIDPNSVENYLLEVDKPMVVPVNTKVRLLVTAADVIHSWWVPVFAVKQDAIPGYINEVWFTAREEGTYRGQCVELCGQDHAFMPVVVKVLSRTDYETWLTSQKAATQTSQNTAQ
jgi:cytochrome c oxidase subunit II